MAGSNVMRDFSQIEKLLNTVDAMRRLKRATQADIAAYAEIHLNTVNRYTALMHKRGWIKPSGQQRQGMRGGPAIVWEWVA